MFNTSTAMGPNRPTSWTSVPSDFNSMSDSQFLFGSQFCPENSQSASAPLEFSIQRQGKSSQQNSQDNEPSIFAKYQSKPLLFGGDGKETGSFNFLPGRHKGILEQFEENKKKIKEKYDSEVLNTFMLNTKDSLHKLQSSLDKSEDIQKSILDGLGNLFKTMQETSESHYGSVLNALKDKNEMEQTLMEMEKRLRDKDTEISDLKSSLQLLKDSLDQLTSQQNEQHLKLCEELGHLQLPRLLADLQAFISAPRIPCHIKDNASQTSPDTVMTQLPYNSHLSVLKAPSGSKVISTVIASQGKEIVNVQQKSHILATGQDADNDFCTCCSSSAVLASSHEESWLLFQEPCQATPMRKVIKRDSEKKGLNYMRHSQLNRTHIGNVLAQNHSDDQKKVATDSEIQSKNVGSISKKEKTQKCSQRKRLYSSRKKRNYSKCANAGLKQNISRKGCSKSENSQDSYKGTKNLNNSNLRPSIVRKRKQCQAQDRKAEKSKVVLQSHENTQYIPNLPEMSGVKKRVNISSTKSNTCFWACSSPDSSLSQSQMRWFNLSDNHSFICATPAQKTPTHCPLFFDSDYSD